MAQASHWRTLAEEAAEEKNSEKLIEIVGTLIRAIDEQEMHSTAPHDKAHIIPLQVMNANEARGSGIE